MNANHKARKLARRAEAKERRRMEAEKRRQLARDMRALERQFGGGA